MFVFYEPIDEIFLNVILLGKKRVPLFLIFGQASKYNKYLQLKSLRIIKTKRKVMAKLYFWVYRRLGGIFTDSIGCSIKYVHLSTF